MKKFLTGVAVGTVIGMLFAPKSGKDMQDEMIKKINELKKQAKEMDMKDVKELALNKLEDAKQAARDFDWKESKEKAEQKYEELKARLNEVKEKLTEEETVTAEVVNSGDVHQV